MATVEPAIWRRSGSVGRTAKLHNMRRLAYGADDIHSPRVVAQSEIHWQS